MIIVHENHGSSADTSAPESVINNKLSVENEANLAIEMLDTVLEAEDEDSDETEINSRRESSQSIKCKDADVPVMILTRDFADEKSPEKSPLQTRNLEIIDPEHIRIEIEAEIDDILGRARASVADIELGKSYEIQSDDDENVFRNRKFLTHLSDLISKSGQQASPIQSKTFERKADMPAVTMLKHSKSAPDFKLLLEQGTNFSDDTSVDYVLNNKDDDAPESLTAPPPPPVFSAELFEKVATLRRKKREVEEKEEEIEQENSIKDDDEQSLEDESVNKENFRDKLEKLLRVPPSRLSMLAPVPMPRTSLINKTEDDNHEEQPSPKESSVAAPLTATMLRQRELFDEVLRKIRKDEDAGDS